MAIITISRGSASGGLLLAQGLSEKLGYGLVSREDVIQAATKYGVSVEKLQETILKPLGFWERFQHERRRYLTFVQEALCDQARKDRIIYHGNAGHLLLRGVSHVICVRLIAPMDFRIRMLMERENMIREDAIRYIERMDRQRKEWTRFLYGVDWLDPKPVRPDDQPQNPGGGRSGGGGGCGGSARGISAHGRKPQSYGESLSRKPGPCGSCRR